MSVPSASLNVPTLMNRALESLRLQRAEHWNPSISLKSFLLVAPNMLVMTFPAMEFFSDEEYDTDRLARTGEMVSRAVCEMMVEEPNVIQRRTQTNYFNIPKLHELIRIAVRATPKAPGEQEVECVATVKRGDVKVRVMVGKVCFQSMPPSDVNAPISNPLFSLPSAMNSIQKEFF